MKILLISDIHANFPALTAIDNSLKRKEFDFIINCGDSLVYGPFPNETMAWLNENKTISILGNTDKKVLKLLRGKSFKKPNSPDKRKMYTWTAQVLQKKNGDVLSSWPKRQMLHIPVCLSKFRANTVIAICHGSPEHDHEFLFSTTPDNRFQQIAEKTSADIVLCGHSHTPFHKHLAGVHFINPGSVGRMFDGDPRCSCAILHFTESTLEVRHLRLNYDIDKTCAAIRANNLPTIYSTMFRRGIKTN